MSDFSARLVNAWYDNKPWLWLLAPLSLLFLLLIHLRRLGFRRRWLSSVHPGVPVIVVGNIAVGGAGKTPLAIALAQRLAAAGYRPGIASRGYGAKPPAFPYTVTPDDNARNAGDEPLLIARRTGLPVVIDPDRGSACRQLIDRHHCNVIVTDDGLQHYRLQRDMEVVVVDGKRGLGNGKVLPMGPLREPPSRLRDVDVVVVNGVAAAPGLATGVQSPPVVAMTLAVDALVSLSSGQFVELAQWQGGKRVHAVAAIGNPRRFFDSLRGQGFSVIEHPFADHHVFTANELDFGDGLPVLMTEKDAVKCQDFALTDQLWFVRVSAMLDDSFYQSIIRRLPPIEVQTSAGLRVF